VVVIHHAIPAAAFRFYKWHTTPSPECPDCHASQEDLSHYIFLCPAKKDACIQLLYKYTNKVDWLDQELENLLKPSRPDFQTLIQKRYLIKVHQLVASGLQGVWTYFIKIFLEELFLPSQTIYSIMSSSTKRYISNKAYLTLKK